MIRKLSSGRYQPRIDCGYDPATGKRVRVKGEIYRTKAAALKAEREMRVAYERGHNIDPSDLTVVDLIERYIDDCEIRGLADKTIEQYRRILGSYFRPHVRMKAAKWLPIHVSAWRTLLLERGGKDQKTDEARPLSAKTVTHAMRLGYGAYRFGKYQLDAVANNPFEGISYPKVNQSPAKMLADEEVRRLLDAARGTRWEAFVTIALYAGLRRGELIALDWIAYNEKTGELSVHCAMSQTKQHGIRKKGTKTGKTRVWPIEEGSALAKALARQRALQASDELAAPHGAYRNVEGAIFTDELGRRYTPMAATDAFLRLARKAKLSTTRLHDLRHHAASQLLAAGVGVVLVAYLMGHSVQTLVRIYAHIQPDAQREKQIAIERLSARIDAIANGGK